MTDQSSGRAAMTRWRSAAALLLLLPLACTGRVADGPPDEAGPAPAPGGGGRPGAAPAVPPDAPAVVPPTAPGRTAGHAPARVRRLSSVEIINAAHDLFPGGATIEAAFPLEHTAHRYQSFYDGLSVSQELADALAVFAQRVATRAISQPAALLSCDPARDGEATCLRQFLGRMVTRVYRRPATPTDEARLTAVFTEARKGFDFNGALGFVIEAMLQSPHFLFRTELGAGTGEAVRLTSYEIASALSFFLWRSTPDERLLQAAANGALATEAGIAAEARRLLQDPRARATMRSFVSEWIETGELATRQQSSRHPQFSATLLRSMEQELAAFVDNVLWTGDLTALLTSARSYTDARLAAIYGARAPGTAFGETALDPARRSGVLTMPAFLASHSPSVGFSPVFLGRVVRTRMLCQPLPDPPNDVPSLPAPAAGVTTRARYARHSNDPACVTCHQLMDPVGFAFEKYDAVGTWREMEEGGVALTGEGELRGTDVDGRFTGAVELGARLARSPDVASCFAAQLLEMAVGRQAAVAPRLAVDDATIAGAAGGKLDQLVVAVVTGGSFLLRDTRALP